MKMDLKPIISLLNNTQTVAKSVRGSTLLVVGVLVATFIFAARKILYDVLARGKALHL